MSAEHGGFQGSKYWRANESRYQMSHYQNQDGGLSMQNRPHWQKETTIEVKSDNSTEQSVEVETNSEVIYEAPFTSPQETLVASKFSK